MKKKVNWPLVGFTVMKGSSVTMANGCGDETIYSYERITTDAIKPRCLFIIEDHSNKPRNGSYLI